MLFETDMDFFKFIQDKPDKLKQFANHMSVYHQGRPSWIDSDFYPVSRLVDGTNIQAQGVLLVDVGGSTGHDLTEFHQKWPQLPGRLILQDLPEVVEEAKTKGLPSPIEPMAHDFFTPQPVNGMQIKSLVKLLLLITLQVLGHTIFIRCYMTGQITNAAKYCLALFQL